MADIKITKTNIDGLCVIEPTVYYDNRGYFFESFNNREFNRNGLTQVFVQDNEVFNHKHVLRGMHVNINRPQGKLIRVLEGKIFDVVIDLRKDSPTYMECYSIELSSENRKQLYIPEGMGHGYLSLEDSRILFKVTTHYTPNDEVEFSWKTIGVCWPVEEANIIQNERDKSNPILSEVLERL